MRILTRADVQQSISMRDAIQAMKDAFTHSPTTKQFLLCV